MSTPTQESTVTVGTGYILTVCERALRYARNRQAESFESDVKHHMETKGMTRERAEMRTHWGSKNPPNANNWFISFYDQWYQASKEVSSMARRFMTAVDHAAELTMTLTISDINTLDHYDKIFPEMEEELPYPDHVYVKHDEFTSDGYEHPPVVEPAVRVDKISDEEAHAIADEFLGEDAIDPPAKPLGFWATLFKHL